MFVHFSDRYWFDIAQIAAKELAVSTVLTPIPDAFKASKVFEKTDILHSASFGSLEKVITLNKENPYALSKADILELSWAEVVFLAITDRNMRVPMSVHYRIQYYYELLRYWLNFLDVNSNLRGKLWTLYMRLGLLLDGEQIEWVGRPTPARERLG
jgi:hypothetical protein